MLVVMRAQATAEQVKAVCEKIESLGYRAHPLPGAERTAIGITGNKGEVQAGTLEEMPGVRIFGPREERAGLVSFVFESAHAHDVVSMADQYGLALRGGHHCTQPLLRKLGVPATARASFYFYNTESEIDRLVEVLREAIRYFGA